MTTKTLFILNDAPYGSERSYNALRLAGELSKREGEEVRVFLMGDAVACAKKGQKTPNGYYNIERMVRVVTYQSGAVEVCGTCMDARGMTDEELAQGTARGTLEQLANWTLWSDRTLVF